MSAWKKLKYPLVDSFWTLFLLVGPRGRKAPGTHCQLRFQLWGPKAGKKIVYTTTVETLLLFSFRVWGSMVHTLLSRPMVCTLVPYFPRKMVYTIAFFCFVTSGSGDRPRKEGSHGAGVHSFFPCRRAQELLWGIEGSQNWCTVSRLERLAGSRTAPVSRGLPAVGRGAWRSLAEGWGTGAGSVC